MTEWIKGKGAQFNPNNRFLKNHFSTSDSDGWDEFDSGKSINTQILYEYPKTLVSKNDSPDLKMMYSVNPYQGCEHGCIYCFARPTHEYWGLGAGLDFESKIIVKRNVSELLRQELMHPKWKVNPIMFSGNTDCYQPLERKYKLTRSLLKVLLEFRHPVHILTKNTLVLRDIDLLEQMSKLNLVTVGFSITTLDEKTRRIMEPRTASSISKLSAIERLRKRGIPVMVMTAPIIPGLNDHEIPSILKASAEAGASSAAYTIVRLNGTVADVAFDLFKKRFPNKVNKIWNQIGNTHGGEVSDSKWSRRLVGSGKFADHIKTLFEISRKKYFSQAEPIPKLRTDIFRRAGTISLFE